MSIMREVAKKLGIKPEALERDAVRLWLLRRLRLIEAEITVILSRYNADSTEDLAALIEHGEVPEHPSWEDLIVLENLVEEKKKIREALKTLESASS